MGEESSQRTLSRSKKLKSKKEIARLFKEGRFMHKYPLGLIFLSFEGESQIEAPFRVAFSVPKKNFKKAVQRNLLKRRMREAFRIHQSLLPTKDEKSVPLYHHLMFIYQSKDIEPYQRIEQAAVKLLYKMQSD